MSRESWTSLPHCQGHIKGRLSKKEKGEPVREPVEEEKDGGMKEGGM